jgi:hypothetical protein
MNLSWSATITSPTPTNMSDDLTAIHAQASAILGRLYDERGQPDELDEAFVQEYFKLVQDNLNLDVEEAEVAPLAPHATNAKLSKVDRGLIEVNVPSKAETFRVSTLAAGE